ncbi:MAG TPA: flavodoxin family protein [Desulfotomaculum sp.]|nr:MAG: NAD(P)H dehydrogenase [Desulfotomaculum sp. BICA1-6]HBX24041.1 flavodoxin family protein [Desulfotomaculum sp.]
MIISVILGHPDNGSFSHAIAETAVRALEENGHEVVFHDLYKEGFDPVLPGDQIPKGAPLAPVIRIHCDEISVADGLIIVHPNWWGMPPAILKGWVDRVLCAGVAYEFVGDDGGEGVPMGLLKARMALVINTSNTPLEREQNVFGDPLELIWRNCIFDLCGVKGFQRKMYGVMVTSTPEQRAAWLEDVKERVDRLFPALSIT